MEISFFLRVNIIRTDVTDLHGLFVKCSRDDADGDDFFLLVNMVRTDVTDLHRLFVKNAHAMTRMTMIFFLLVNMIRTDVTDLHGLFVKNSPADCSDYADF